MYELFSIEVSTKPGLISRVFTPVCRVTREISSGAVKGKPLFSLRMDSIAAEVWLATEALALPGLGVESHDGSWLSFIRLELCKNLQELLGSAQLQFDHPDLGRLSAGKP